MGQVPPKYLMPSAPYGQSDAANAVNSVQPAAINPQTPLLPPNFTDPGAQSNPLTGGNPQAPKNPFSMNPQRYPQLGNLSSFYGGMYR